MLRKFLQSKKIWAASLVIALLAFGMAQAAGTAAQRSSLSGVVVSAVSTGTKVTEGDVLVSVKTLAGSAPAARANCSGTVSAVKVTVGSQIAADQVVAEIQQ